MNNNSIINILKVLFHMLIFVKNYFQFLYAMNIILIKYLLEIKNLKIIF